MKIEKCFSFKALPQWNVGDGEGEGPATPTDDRHRSATRGTDRVRACAHHHRHQLYPATRCSTWLLRRPPRWAQNLNTMNVSRRDIQNFLGGPGAQFTMTINRKFRTIKRLSFSDEGFPFVFSEGSPSLTCQELTVAIKVD